jgi:hypothetical protein
MSFAYCALLDNKNQLLTQNKQQSQSSSTEQVSSTREGEGDKLSLRLVRHAYARHHSKNRQADTYYLAVDAWRRHVSPDEGIGISRRHEQSVLRKMLQRARETWSEA